ncbi:uncharacterized protein DUF4350 [Microbacterium sp. AG1240]|uniref:DUF4350 domain-containing protein n=1 Tax=Microbacterium sp. AG1240 TaxID=2183992 RepID=UPI000EB2BF61|nr:DUF4350 domain-containing protein [Microbacterium sp. AG1240]RKT36367.1 uncharacterized protein DUF4350 [Microbacterium sp. AG1240]
MTVTTERTRIAAAPNRLRRALLGWGAIVAAVVALALIGTVLAGDGWAERDALDPESAGPAGTGALARILVDQGIDVRVTRDRATARAALGGGATLVLPDAPALSDEAIGELASAADEIVILEPRSRTLRLLLPGSQLAGSAGTDELAPACDLAVADRAGGVVGGSLMTPGDGVTGCYPSGDGFALLVGETGPTRVTAVDGRAMFANDVLADAGNAALALGIVGTHPRVVWYVPSLSDSDISTAAPTLGELTPRWVTPALVLLLLAAVAAGFWRGRRFGPLVVENLPVVVRASETTAGRARLYARANDPGHALDQLRLGALERLARMLGLSATARPEDIVDAVAARLGGDHASVRSILIDTTPRNDSDLVEWAARLRDLEARVHAAVRPERNTR